MEHTKCLSSERDNGLIGWHLCHLCTVSLSCVAAGSADSAGESGRAVINSEKFQFKQNVRWSAD